MRRHDLRRLSSEGQIFEYVFFWSHKPSKDGELSAACFSQWWPAPMTITRQRYPTAEHFMMAEKARLFGDHGARARVLSSDDPAAAKRRGRAVRGFSEPAWEAAREGVIYQGNLAKFTQHPQLRAVLLQTGSRVLVEASPTDCVWGIGLAAGDAMSRDPQAWRGLNLLGFVLMDVRAALA